MSEDTNHLSDHHDIDALSDAGTYIIEDDESEQKFNPSVSSSAFKRYVNPTQHRHGTFDIHGLIASTSHTIHRPVVDANIPQEDFSASSTDSSLLSFNEDEEIKSSTQDHCLIPAKQSQIKPAESFGKQCTFLLSNFFSSSYFTGIRNEIFSNYKSFSTKNRNSMEVSRSSSKYHSSINRFSLDRNQLSKNRISFENHLHILRNLLFDLILSFMIQLHHFNDKHLHYPQ